MILEILKASISSEQPASGQEHSCPNHLNYPSPCPVSEMLIQLLNQLLLPLSPSLFHPYSSTVCYNCGCLARRPLQPPPGHAVPPLLFWWELTPRKGWEEEYIQARLLSQSQPGPPTCWKSRFRFLPRGRQASVVQGEKLKEWTIQHLAMEGPLGPHCQRK